MLNPKKGVGGGGARSSDAACFSASYIGPAIKCT